MKTNKIFILTIFTAISLLSAGCTGKTPGTPEAVSEAASEIASVTAEVELPDGELCVPSYLSGSEAEGFTIVTEDEDSVTYQLTGKQRAEAAGQIAAQLDESIAQVLADKEHYPNISTVSVNEDCTEFNVTFLGTELNTYETTLRMSLYIVGDKFQLYQGKAVEELLTAVNYIDEISGETFSTGTSH